MKTWSVSTGTADFVVRVDKKLLVGSRLFKNCNSLFGTQGAVLVAKGLTTLIGLFCQMMLQIIAPCLISDNSSPKFDRKQGVKCSEQHLRKKLSYSDVSPKEQMLLHANSKVMSVALPQKQLHV